MVWGQNPQIISIKLILRARLMDLVDLRDLMDQDLYSLRSRIGEPPEE